MASRRRISSSSPALGPLSVRLLEPRRVLDLHAGLAALLGTPESIDADRLDAALACAYDASTLASGDCRAQATMVLMGFREFRPAGLLDPPLAFLAMLALLDANGFGLDDVPYPEVVARLEGLLHLQPELGEVEALHRWLIGCTRPSATRAVPLPAAELCRLLEAGGFKVESREGRLQVLRPRAGHKPAWWMPDSLRRPTWELLHSLPEPGEGGIGVAALRELRSACGLTSEPFVDDRAWQAGILRQYRHLWPRLRGLWPV